MFTLDEFEDWAFDKEDFTGLAIYQGDLDKMRDIYFEKYPGNYREVTRRMVMRFLLMSFGVVDMEPLEFEKVYWPRRYAVSMEAEVKRMRVAAEKQALQVKRAPPAKQAPSAKQVVPQKQASVSKQAPAPRQPPPPKPASQSKSPPPPPPYELEAAPVKAKPVLQATPKASRDSINPTKLDAELWEYKQASTKTRGDLAYALYKRGRVSEEEYTRFCSELRESMTPK
ncbi:hypothetical protein EAF04_003845 [Stromatinia cepivora]|nr:hypothetical protein EAF04_003845 [Stromatinia cepivora]